MTAQPPNPIRDAGEAFRTGDFAHGSMLLHQVLRGNILNEEAWRLLYRYIGRDLLFADFQQHFTEKYYPDQLERLTAHQKEALSLPSTPFRRVSLTSDNAHLEDPDDYGMLDFPRPKTGPLPEPRQVEKFPDPRPPFFLKRWLSSLGKIAKKGRNDRPPAARKRARRSIGDRLSGFGRGFFRRKSASVRKVTDVSTENGPGEPAPRPVDSTDSGLSLLSLNKPKSPDVEDNHKPASETGAGAGERTLVRSLGERHGIRVLIADDIDHTREMIQKLLMFEPTIDVVGVASNGAEAVAQAIELEPDIVLLDINMPDMDGLEALERIRRRLPLTQVIMLTVQDDPGYLREALQAGARDYLIKPPMIDDLLETINQAHAIGKAERDRLETLARRPEIPAEALRPDIAGRTVAVFSPKGGVGCTLIAANLAAVLRSGNTPVVLLDCDLKFGSVGLFFNEFARDSITDLAQNLEKVDERMVSATAVNHSETGVHLLLAPGGSDKSGHVTGRQMAALIRYLRTIYAYVVVDTPSTVDDITLSVMDVADEVLLVTTQEIPAINDVRKMLDLAHRAGIDPGKVSLVLNQYHPQVKITPEQIARNLRITFAGVIPFDRQTATTSINKGMPFMADPIVHTQPIGTSFRELADQVVRVARSEAAD